MCLTLCLPMEERTGDAGVSYQPAYARLFSCVKPPQQSLKQHRQGMWRVHDFSVWDHWPLKLVGVRVL